MKVIEAETSLVVTGQWNPAILNPQWIGRNILDIPDGQDIPIEIEMPMTLGLPPRIKIQNFSYVARSARLILTPSGHSEAVLNATEAAVRKILELLRYTPVTGFGFNFEFLEDHPAEDVLTHFDAVGNDIVPNVGEAVTVVERNTVISFSRAQGLVNVTRSLANNLLKANFNFHYPLTQASDLANIPPNKFVQDLAFATHLMDEIYGLEEVAQ